ncbi:MAG: holo-ACP synthase [Alphaproteobacteria bacterium]|nr:holo-ACP synthase [Alphaproteobacteria bacterium]
MILGIGNDLVDIRRIEESLARFGKRFENRIFTEGEKAKAHSRAGGGAKVVAATFAKRFAAKEACAKALGNGLRDMTWRDIEVVSAANGAPTILLHGGAKKCLEGITPAGMQAKIWLTLTDEYPYAQAQVFIEAGPA